MKEGAGTFHLRPNYICCALATVRYLSVPFAMSAEPLTDSLRETEKKQGK